MATKLTNPIPVADIADQGITKLEFHIPHKRSADGLSAVFNRDKIYLRYEVTTWNADGKVLERKAREVPFASWTPGFKIDMQAVYQTVTQDAKQNNLIGAGTDEDITT